MLPLIAKSKRRSERKEELCMTSIIPTHLLISESMSVQLVHVTSS